MIGPDDPREISGLATPPQGAARCPFSNEPGAVSSGPALATGELYRLVYFSTSLLPPLDCGGEREIHDILRVAHERNSRQRVTGALAYNEFNFAQALEGARRDVDDIFASILRDPRHRDVVVVEEQWIEARDFGAWAMAYVGDRNALRVISPNLQLQDIIAHAHGDAIALIQMMKFFLQSAAPR